MSANANTKRAQPAEDLSATMVWTPGPASRSSCQIGRRIGAGGFAEVFEAELLDPHRPQRPRRVALKRLLPSLRGDPLRQRQLRREAQIAASLNHPNIARVLSLVELGDGEAKEVALAMELCEGLQCNHLLYRLAQHGLGLRIEAVAHIAVGLFSALKYLENPLGTSRPLVHADISLENLMVTRDGEVKLIDFGIAAEELGRSAADPRSEEALTSLHQAAGKRPYLPPEGMPPHGPSSQSDLYAAGVCFWELCTGSRFPVLPPHVGERELGSLIAFAATERPQSAWRLLASCLSIQPAARLRMADEGLALCRGLSGDQEIEEALGVLVMSAMAVAGLDLSPLVVPSDYFSTLCRRLRDAFCAHRVSALSTGDDDPSGMAVSAPSFTVRAQTGEPAGQRPSDELLREVLDIGFVEMEDGELLFRVRPPGERAHVIYVEPGPDCGYDPLGQALLRNLLHTGSR